MFHTASVSTPETRPASLREGATAPAGAPTIFHASAGPAELESYIRFYLNEAAKSQRDVCAIKRTSA
jgi:hypothetical protein